MSRSKNDHKKTYNFPLWEARRWARKSIRAQGNHIINECLKVMDVEDVPTFIFEGDRSGRKGNVFNWD